MVWVSTESPVSVYSQTQLVLSRVGIWAAGASLDQADSKFSLKRKQKRGTEGQNETAHPAIS